MSELTADPISPQRKNQASIDFVLVAALVRRHKVALVLIALVGFPLILLACGLFIPQSFTSQISMSFPQSAQPTALALLTGSGATGNRYIGVLRSRRFAEDVLKRTDVMELCGFRTDELAIEAMTKGLGVTENVRDSLVYLTVSLPGPPRLALGSGPKRARVKTAAAHAANAYANVLWEYMATSDTDRDAVLLRAAEDQLNLARKEYESAVSRLAAFVTRPRAEIILPAQDSGTESSSSSTTGSSPSRMETGTGTALSATAAHELESLYIERGKLEGEIQAATAARETGESLRHGQLNRLGSLPEEDPLLASARAAVHSARLSRDNLSLQYGPDHPEMIRAQERLKLAEANLRKQVKAVATRDTTEDVSAEVTLSSLTAQLAVVERLITTAEKKAHRGINFSTQYERRKNEVLLRLEVLKATASQAAILSLQTVSLKNRMAVVDTARLAKSGTPNFVMFVAISLTLTLALEAAYLYRASRRGVARWQTI